MTEQNHGAMPRDGDRWYPEFAGDEPLGSSATYRADVSEKPFRGITIPSSHYDDGTEWYVEVPGPETVSLPRGLMREPDLEKLFGVDQTEEKGEQ